MYNKYINTTKNTMDPKYTFAGTAESNTSYILTACYVLLWIICWPLALVIMVGGVLQLRKQWKSNSGVFSDTAK
jgi:hypothetical protein